MARAGRKRKAGERYPSGDIKRPTMDRLNAMADAQRRKEQQTVLDQPHRRILGDRCDHKWGGSALGHLMLRHGLRHELFDAGQEYARIVKGWQSCWGAPRGTGHPPSSAGGEGPTTEAADKMRTQMIAIETSVTREAGHPSLIAVQQLVLIEGDIAPEQDQHAIDGLMVIARYLGRIDAKHHPFEALDRNAKS